MTFRARRCRISPGGSGAPRPSHAGPHARSLYAAAFAIGARRGCWRYAAPCSSLRVVARCLGWCGLDLHLLAGSWPRPSHSPSVPREQSGGSSASRLAPAEPISKQGDSPMARRQARRLPTAGLPGSRRAEGGHPDHPPTVVEGDCLPGSTILTLGYQPDRVPPSGALPWPAGNGAGDVFGPCHLTGRVHSPQRPGQHLMLEELLPRWKGKAFVLVLLGFASRDFIITSRYPPRTRRNIVETRSSRGLHHSRRPRPPRLPGGGFLIGFGKDRRRRLAGGSTCLTSCCWRSGVDASAIRHLGTAAGRCSLPSLGARMIGSRSSSSPKRQRLRVETGVP